ncbi:hypothetical protein B0H11DRAFT_327115 [Mycena galericulata]|nr:hypothetical protein B0H11DRAFT_327115 [Mycena galericulata]
MRPAAPFRPLLRTSVRTHSRPIVPFHARPSFSTHPPQQPTKHESYFRRLDNRIAERFGIGKRMRITLYVILGAVSAVETWFYCFWAWQWWKRAGPEGDGDEVEA